VGESTVSVALHVNTTACSTNCLPSGGRVHCLSGTPREHNSLLHKPPTKRWASPLPHWHSTWTQEPAAQTFYQAVGESTASVALHVNTTACSTNCLPSGGRFHCLSGTPREHNSLQHKPPTKRWTSPLPHWHSTWTQHPAAQSAYQAVGESTASVALVGTLCWSGQTGC
jgi:hypothetical protein